MTSTGSLTAASTMLVVSWLEENRGPASVEDLFSRLSRRGRALSRRDLSPRGKVDYRLHLEVLEEVRSLAGGDDAMLRSIGRNGARNVEAAVPGAGLMLKMANPKRLLKHAGKLWRTYADFGRVEVLSVEEGRAQLRLAGFETHPDFCRTLEGFFEGLLERVGAQDIAVREVAHAGDGTGCVFEGTWC